MMRVPRNPNKEYTMDYKQKAIDESKKGGDIERAKVYAMLALVQAVEDNTEEIRSIGAEAWPLHVTQ